MMLELQIEMLQRKLNLLVDEDLYSEEVYKLSTELDKLIIKFYKQKGFTAESNKPVQM